MNGLKHAVGAVLVAVATLATATAHAGEAAGAIELSLSPAVVTLSPGVSTWVVLQAEGVPAPGLAAFQVELAYDPALAEVRDPNAGLGSSRFAAFTPIGLSPECASLRGVTKCSEPPWLLASTGREALGRAWVRPAQGRVVIAYGSYGEAKLAIGSGALALLEVIGKRAGRMRLQVSDAILADASDPPRVYGWRPTNHKGGERRVEQRPR